MNDLHCTYIYGLIYVYSLMYTHVTGKLAIYHEILGQYYLFY